jgi:hypothetical protein
MVQGRVAAVVAAIVLFIGSGCLRPRDTRFYVLTPLPATERPTEASSGRGPVVGLRPVGLPDQLDRPQIVTRVGGNMLQLAEFDYWAASLRDNFSRVLAEDLAILVPTERVALFPWSREAGVDYEVTVEVVRFEGALGGESALVADWTIMKRARGAKDMATTGRSNHTEPTGGSYTDVAAAGSRLIAALSRDIAKALNAMPR